MKQAAPPAWSMPAQPKGQVVPSFKVTKKLPPDTPGAQRLLQRFGEALVCVRHRVTPDCEARCTTVELVLEQVPIRSRPDQLVGVFRLVTAKRLCNHRSRPPAVCGTLRLVFGSCHSAQTAGWSFPTAYVFWRNEIDVESVPIQKSCIYTDLDG